MNSNEILNFIKSRRSMGNLTTPAPSREQIETAIEVAMSAPDHKTLQPYRFIVLQGNSLRKFGQALKQSAIDQGETSEATLTKTENLPNRAPMIITCVTRYRPNDKVPQYEQLLCCGATVQNLLLALQALGFASVWRTGLLANEPAVKQFFNLDEPNHVVGFVYVGTAGADMPKRGAILVDDFIQYRD